MDNSEQLMRALQILAAPAEAQIAHYPDFVVVGDELALDFEDACRQFLPDASGLTEEQRRSIAALDMFLEELSGHDNERFWLDRSALRKDERWCEIRAKAAEVLDAFGWPHEVPPRSDATYVSGGMIWRGGGR